MNAIDLETTRRQLEGLAVRVFPAPMRVAVVPIGDVSLKPEEERAVERAIDRRRAEFSAGRQAARQAIGRDVAIPMAIDRSPVWPDGVTGSISHAGGWAVAAVGEGLIGLDLELDAELPEEIWDTVLLPQERGLTPHQARLIFSAKEAVYKAQYPQTGALFGFETLAITLGDDTFRAEFQRDVGPFRAGHGIDGRFAIGGGFILTGTQ
ncbi:4'-phosphopantetheinyl transferase superfamily protein [Rhodobacter sp. NTK016B]|uniref:4'-phosphopantetheinyl transferase family protein n=1 Tax=Rhodobacter sp. NTK016B TaxID=2759676 RepID=UPI001A8DA584|nr:4'-phosphopantetheinyl transferase superfamily protein [Rhodobacter sp. NTK016B]